MNNLKELKERKAFLKKEIAGEEAAVKRRTHWIQENKSLLLWEWIRPKKGLLADLLQPIVPALLQQAGEGFAQKLGKGIYEKYLSPLMASFFSKEEKKP